MGLGQGYGIPVTFQAQAFPYPALFWCFLADQQASQQCAVHPWIGLGYAGSSVSAELNAYARQQTHTDPSIMNSCCLFLSFFEIQAFASTARNGGARQQRCEPWTQGQAARYVCLCTSQWIDTGLNLWTGCLDLPPGSTDYIEVPVASDLNCVRRGGESAIKSMLVSAGALVSMSYPELLKLFVSLFFIFIYFFVI